MKRQLFITGAIILASLNMRGQVALTVNSSSHDDPVSDLQYGIFFEEINHAGDGGLYAELVANRSFESHLAVPKYLEYWENYQGGTMSSVSSAETAMLNSVQRHAVRVVTNGADGGILNEGYKGICITGGNQYKLRLFAKGAMAGTVLTVKLLGSDKTTVLGSTTLNALTTDWTKYETTITATGTDNYGTLSITANTASTFYLDVVSLFPPTFNGRDNGMRKDLAQLLADLHPAFMRFPGGCYVEGLNNGNCPTNCHYEWKNAIGPVEEREGHYNNNWGYEISDGMGAMEFLQFCEDIGAKPLYVTNIGIGHNWYQSADTLQAYIQDALDFIEFCNGDATTTWGAKRTALGHPQPFNLGLIEIGNENNPMLGSGEDPYHDYYYRYQQFYKAIHAAYPDMKFIGCTAWNGGGWADTCQADYGDEHYYNTPDWFIANYTKYDGKSASEAVKSYVGEYAVTQNFGTVGNLEAALGEGVFMEGMERNSRYVKMASYAPIFWNEDMNYGWTPDMIRFNTHSAIVTPSYYMQKLFPNYMGKYNVVLNEDNNNRGGYGHVGLGSWLSAVKYSNLKITDNDTGTTLFVNDIATAANWTKNNTNTSWTNSDGTISQSDATIDNQTYILNKTITTGNYTYEVEAVKNGGKEGFIIPFYYFDADNRAWFNIGGWGNTSNAIQQKIAGVETTYWANAGQTFKAIENGTTYKIKIVVTGGNHVKAYINDALYVDVDILSCSPQRYLYTSGNVTADGSTVYLRVINPYADAQSLSVKMTDKNICGIGGEVLTGNAKTDENTMSNPDNVVPKSVSGIAYSGDSFSMTVPAYSAYFFKISIADAAGIHAVNGETASELANNDSRRYNLTGQCVGSCYKGIIIKKNKKYIVK